MIEPFVNTNDLHMPILYPITNANNISHTLLKKTFFNPQLIPYTNFTQPNVMFPAILESVNIIASKYGSSSMLPHD